MNKPRTDLNRFDEEVSSLDPAYIAYKHKQQEQINKAQFQAFKDQYAKGKCYMCGLKFWDMDRQKPCSHWLMKPNNFKKKDFPLVFQAFNYHQIAALLMWVANQESFIRNINNLESDKGDKKVFSYTIVWKNIEWTFDCAESDYAGHVDSQFPDPHYHFQMRIDGKQFINFNDFHVPFTDYDIYTIDLQKHRSNVFHHSFGLGGPGMQQAIEVDPELIIEHTRSIEFEDQAMFRMNTMIQADGAGIPGEILDQIMQESKATGKTMASLARKYLDGKAIIETQIMPIETIPEIAARTGGRRKKEKIYGLKNYRS